MLGKYLKKNMLLRVEVLQVLQETCRSFLAWLLAQGWPRGSPCCCAVWGYACAGGGCEQQLLGVPSIEITV